MGIFGKKEVDMETWHGDGYCVKCKEKRDFEGTVKISDSGRRMAMGTCPICGTKMNRILGKQTEMEHVAPLVEDSSGKSAVEVIAAQIGDPNLFQTQMMAERVLNMLLEVDPDIQNKIELWDDKRVERKLYKKWRKKIGAEIANEIEKLNLDEVVSRHPLLLEAIVDVKRHTIHIAKGE